MRNARLTGSIMLVAGLLAACSGDSPTEASAAALAVTGAGHNAADHFSGVNPIEFEIQSPCNGETILFTGTSTYQITTVNTRAGLDNGYWVHSELFDHARATGIGQTTGATYTLDDRFHEVFQSPSAPAPQVTFSAHANTRVVADVVGLSFDGRFQFHFVGLPTGDFKVTRDFFTDVCRG